MAIKGETLDLKPQPNGIKSEPRSAKTEKDEEKDELAALDALEKEASEFNKARANLTLYAT